MFNGGLKNEDVEFYEFNSSSTGAICLKDDCKPNIVIVNATANAGNINIHLPTASSYIGKVLTITYATGGATGKNGLSSNAAYIMAGGSTTITTLRSCQSVTFIYMGQYKYGIGGADDGATGYLSSGWLQLGIQGGSGGTNNTGNAQDKSIAIGDSAYANAGNSTVVGGSCYTSGIGATILGYSSNSNSNYSVVIGNACSASGINAIAIGEGNTNNGVNAVILGRAITSAATATVTIGYGGLASAAGTISIGYIAGATTTSTGFYIRPSQTTSVGGVNGDNQVVTYMPHRQTTDATPTYLTSSNGVASTTNLIGQSNNSATTIVGTILARESATGDSAMWEVKFLMKRGANASATVLVGTPTVTKLFNDAGAAAWTISVNADTTSGGAYILATGEAAKTIKWTSDLTGSFVTG